MGCAKSSNVVAPLEHIVYPKGVLTVELQNAVLFRDTAVMMKMDPFAVLKLGDQTLKSLVQKNQGAEPVFHEKFSFYINSDKVFTGRCLELQMWDKNIVTDRQIGFGTVDVDPIILNRITNYTLKCHLGHDGKRAGWIKSVISFKEDFKGKILIKPKTAKLTRKIGFGNMDCAVKIIIGEDVAMTKVSTQMKDNPPIWEQTLVLNMINSLNKGKLQIMKVNGGDSQEMICEIDLDLQKYSTKQQSEHQLQLKYKDTYAGNIKFSSMLLSIEEFQRFKAIQHSQIKQVPLVGPPLSPQKQHHSVSKQSIVSPQKQQYISPQKQYVSQQKINHISPVKSVQQKSQLQDSKISNPQSQHNLG